MTSLSTPKKFSGFIFLFSFSVQLGDMGDRTKVEEQGKVSPIGWRGQGGAQQHRRDRVRKEWENSHPQRKRSATAWAETNLLASLGPDN